MAQFVYIKLKPKIPRDFTLPGLQPLWSINMIALTPDEVALLKSLLIALRGIKTKDIDKALVILSKRDRRQSSSGSGRAAKK
jgi:hypothetical protein